MKHWHLWFAALVTISGFIILINTLGWLVAVGVFFLFWGFNIAVAEVILKTQVKVGELAAQTSKGFELTADGIQSQGQQIEMLRALTIEAVEIVAEIRGVNLK